MEPICPFPTLLICMVVVLLVFVAFEVFVPPMVRCYHGRKLKKLVPINSDKIFEKNKVFYGLMKDMLCEEDSLVFSLDKSDIVDYNDFLMCRLTSHPLGTVRISSEVSLFVSHLIPGTLVDTYLISNPENEEDWWELTYTRSRCETLKFVMIRKDRLEVERLIQNVEEERRGFVA